MIAEELINQMIPPLKIGDTAQKALQWMDEFRVNQLPVVNKNLYCGMVSEDLVYKHNNANATLGELDLLCTDVFVHHNQHFYDILRLSNLYNIQTIAVLDDEQHFLGVVTVQDVINAFASSVSMQEQGGILVFLIDKRDYSLTEISRLVESNNAKILSTYITDDKHDLHKLRITIKINTPDLNRIVATFERYNYRIVAQFQSHQYQEVERDRLDMFFKYLNI
ncbi:MAG: CBS domain-containing protein [Bacteroidetes bacterium]|nr:MAG: CBS domain-containing protein [Bacteroidota bacterium]